MRKLYTIQLFSPKKKSETINTVRDTIEGGIVVRQDPPALNRWVLSYMRYTIIHHDVREMFDLSLYEYVVCDSIYQLSYFHGLTKTNSELADFLGIDRANISRIKERLLEKGLILQGGDNTFGSSEVWVNAVTQRSVQNQQKRAISTPKRAPSTESVLPAHSLYLYKEYKDIYITADAEKTSKKPKDKNAKLILSEQESLQGRKFANPVAQMSAISRMLQSGYTKEQILEEYEYLSNQPYWEKRGVDFLIVASQIHKEHE